MSGELFQKTETYANFYFVIRDKVCGECPGGKYCSERDCNERFLAQAAKMEMKMERVK